MAKREFSISEALGAGFELGLRRPLTVFVWGLLGWAPLLVFAPVWGDMLTADWWTTDQSASPFDPALMQTFWKWQLLGHLSNLVQLAVWVMVTAAAFRLVLRPREAARRPFGLGLGMDELRVAVVAIALFIGMMVVILVAVLLGGALAALVWSLGDAARAVVMMGLPLAALGLILVLFARVCLMAPASVAQQDFAFEGGWRLGRGRTVKLILLILVVWILTCVIVLGAYLVMGLLVWGLWSALGLGWPESAAQLLHIVRTDTRLWIAAGVAAIPLMWLGGLLAAVAAAPFASVVRQLTPAPSADEPAPSETQGS